MELAWWHWMVLGLGLGLLELVVPSFFILWFGLGALLVGVAMLGEKYIQAIGNPAKSDNTKPPLMPTDIQDTRRGILGSGKLRGIGLHASAGF